MNHETANRMGRHTRLGACVATFTNIKCYAEAKHSSDVPLAIRHEANLSAGGVPPAGVALENPYKDDKQRAQTGERLFSSMNCDGCHGGGGLGSMGPSLVDGRWHYGGADGEIFHSIFYGRAKGMPAYGGVLGSEGIWMIVTYLSRSPCRMWCRPLRMKTLRPMRRRLPTLRHLHVAPQPALPATGVEGMLAKYGCVACHTVDNERRWAGVQRGCSKISHPDGCSHLPCQAGEKWQRGSVGHDSHAFALRHTEY